MLTPVQKMEAEYRRKARSRRMADILISRGSASKTMRQIAIEELEGSSYTFNDLRSHRRYGDLCQIRHRIFWRCRNETHHSFPAIGRFFDRDHATVLYGVRKFEQEIRTDE